MQRLLLTAIAAACALLPSAIAVGPPNALTERERQEGYVLLFNGKDLEGWEGDSRLWSVADGAIVGCTDAVTVSRNTFLVYQTPFSNFILKAEIRLRNGNSGIQFRSRRSPDWVVAGYQADASDMGERSAWGNLYDEKGRGRGVMNHPNEGWEKAKQVLRPGGWNEYVIVADGPRIRLELNGVETINVKDDAASDGVIAIQLHQGPPMKVEVRNVKLKRLP